MTICLRMLQGSASAAINSTAYGLAADRYPKHTEQMIGLLEAFSGIGGIAGLLGGATIYNTFGYKATFLLFGGMLPIIAVLSRLVFTSIQNEEDANSDAQRPLLDNDGEFSSQRLTTEDNIQTGLQHVENQGDNDY